MINWDFLQDPHEARAFGFSFGIVALSVIAVMVFALTRGSVLFYLFALLAIALGFYMAYHLSKGPRAESEAAKPRRKRTGKQ